MRYCQSCGGPILKIGSRGGCGGNGSLHRCTSCGQVYRQETGGILSTPGGETFKPISESMSRLLIPSLPTLEEWRKSIIEDSKKFLFSNKGKEGDKYG